MTVENRYEARTIVASTDLTGHQFKAVGEDGLVAETTAAAKGILRNKPLNGDHATIAYKGQMKAYAGGAINSGALVGVTTSGFLITVTTSAYVGVCLVTAGSGDIFPFVGDFNMGLIA
jgi:hypothetical protein